MLDSYWPTPVAERYGESDQCHRSPITGLFGVSYLLPLRECAIAACCYDIIHIEKYTFYSCCGRHGGW